MSYTKGDYVIGVGILFENKRPSLYIGSECCIRKVASFLSDEAAESFKNYLEYFFDLRDDAEEVDDGKT